MQKNTKCVFYLFVTGNIPQLHMANMSIEINDGINRPRPSLNNWLFLIIIENKRPIITDKIRPPLKTIAGKPRADYIGVLPKDPANSLNQFSVQLNQDVYWIDNPIHIIKIKNESKPHNPANFNHKAWLVFVSISL